MRMKKKNRPAIVIETTGRPLRPAERNPEREREPVYPPRSEAEAILAAKGFADRNHLRGFRVLYGPNGSIAQWAPRGTRTLQRGTPESVDHAELRPFHEHW